METIVKSLGFESLEEYHRLVAHVELDTPQKIKQFDDWKNNDGSKKGILKLSGCVRQAISL